MFSFMNKIDILFREKQINPGKFKRKNISKNECQIEKIHIRLLTRR